MQAQSLRSSGIALFILLKTLAEIPFIDHKLTRLEPGRCRDS